MLNFTNLVSIYQIQILNTSTMIIEYNGAIILSNLTFISQLEGGPVHDIHAQRVGSIGLASHQGPSVGRTVGQSGGPAGTQLGRPSAACSPAPPHTAAVGGTWWDNCGAVLARSPASPIPLSPLRCQGRLPL